MVKVSAPMLSMDASGTIGKAAVFSKWKGRNYVRSHVVPHNPKSAGQIGVRSMFKFLAQEWNGLGPTPKGTWSEIATALNISGFNSYIRANQRRWRNFRAPSMDETALEGHTSAVLNAWTATVGIRQIDLLVSLTTANANWGAMIFRNLVTGFTPTWSDCIAVISVTGTGSHHFIDTPLVADTYYYKHRLFTDDGKLSTASAEVNGVVA